MTTQTLRCLNRKGETFLHRAKGDRGALHSAFPLLNTPLAFSCILSAVTIYNDDYGVVGGGYFVAW